MLARSFLQLVILLVFALPLSAQAKLRVVATTSDIASLVRTVGGDDVQVSSIAKGSQDPHYVEAKPSFMVGVRDADLVVSNGLSLEVGWLPSLIRGARNPKVNPGSSGYLELGSIIQPLDVPTGQVTRAMGDVHPEGNPHFTLDPIRMGELSVKLAERMGELDASKKESFMKRAKDFEAAMSAKTSKWQARIAKSKVKKVVSYHPSLNYFLNRFGLTSPIYLENKPGIPPTAKHILDVIRLMKAEGIKLILVDNYFDTKIAQSVAKEVPGTTIASVGIAVESKSDLKSIDDVIEQLVQAVESVK